MAVRLEVTWDREDDLGYVYLRPIEPGGVKHTYTPPPDEVCGNDINLDFDADGRLVGIEFLGASTALPEGFLSGG